jgi:small-conductance mechanosensitive channel
MHKMKIESKNLRIVSWLNLLFILLLLEGLYGQETIDSQIINQDTVTAQAGIPYNEILIAAGESRIRAIRIEESLISPQRIERENERNDSILVLIDSALSRANTHDYRQESQRFLTNERNYWKTASDHINEQKERLSDVIRGLQDQQQQLGIELRRWENTRQLMDSSYASGNISRVIDSTLGKLNSLADEIEGRTALLITPLNRTIRTEVEVDLHMEEIRQALVEKTSLAYSKTAPVLFEKAPANKAGVSMRSNIVDSLKSEWNAVIFYFQQRKNTLIQYLVFVLGILVLFSWISTRIKDLKADNLSYYESTFKTILRRPLTAGILFSLFFSVAFFPDRPPLLLDLIILLLLVPIVDIGRKLGSRGVQRYLWVFIGVILLLLVIRLIPAETLLFRYTLLVLGILELLLLYRLYRHPEVLLLPTRTLTWFVRFLVKLHFVIVAIAVIAGVLGYVRLGKVGVESFLTNALTGILLFISAIILIGGLQFFIGSRYTDRFQVIRDHEDYLKRLVARIIIVGVTLFWVDAILRIFYLKNVVYEFLGSIFFRELSIGSMTFSLSKIVLFVFIIWLSIIASRVIKMVLRTDVLDKLSLKKGIPRMITAITQFALITIGLLMAVRAIGMPLDQLTIIFSAFSVGIGFGLQNIFNNLVSGVILLFEREVQIGDIIEVGSLMGTVKSMGIRSSHVRTFEGADVIVPNGQLISKEVVDWTLSDKSRRIEIISGVAYGSDVHLVKKLLMQIIDEHPDVKPDPAPLVLFNGMGESSLDFRLLFWTANFEEWLRIRSEVVFAIHDVLNENGITIPFPQRDLHLKTVDPLIFPQKDEK